MTAKEVETVAVLLKRVRERADAAQQAVTRPTGVPGVSVISPDYVVDLAEALRSLAAAVEMVMIEVPEMLDKAALDRANFRRELEMAERTRRGWGSR